MNASIDQLRPQIVATIRRWIPTAHRIFLFGSRAQGTATPTADIDIGVVAAHPVPFATLAELREALDALPTLLKIDCVDFTNRADDFTREALRSLQVWYENHSTTHSTP